MNKLSDETLTAYLDGELPATERAMIDAALATDVRLNERLAALDLPLKDLRRAFDSRLSAAPAFAASVAEPHRKFGGLAVAAALGAGLLIGAGAATGLAYRAQSEWTVAVATYQMLYVPATVAGLEPTEAVAMAQLAGLSKTLGRDITAARDADGVDFRRAQILEFGGQPLVQIAYATPDGTPVALCIKRVASGDYAPRSETLKGLSAVHWARDGFGYLVIGGQDAALVGRLAEGFLGRV